MNTMTALDVIQMRYILKELLDCRNQEVQAMRFSLSSAEDIAKYESGAYGTDWVREDWLEKIWTDDSYIQNITVQSSAVVYRKAYDNVKEKYAKYCKKSKHLTKAHKIVTYVVAGIIAAFLTLVILVCFAGSGGLGWSFFLAYLLICGIFLVISRFVVKIIFGALNKTMKLTLNNLWRNYLKALGVDYFSMEQIEKEITRSEIKEIVLDAIQNMEG